MSGPSPASALRDPAGAEQLIGENLAWMPIESLPIAQCAGAMLPQGCDCVITASRMTGHSPQNRGLSATLPRMKTIALMALALLLSSCGGGSSGSTPPSGSSGGVVITQQQRIDAATATAAANAACTAIVPFYWEIGDSSAMITGSTEPTGTMVPDATTVMELFSASKWLFSTFAVQKLGGVANLSTSDIQALTMTSAYNLMNNGSCTVSDTVASCDAAQNTMVDTTHPDYFVYNSGHLEHLGATSTGLAVDGDDDTALKTDMDAELGSDLTYVWDTPELAGGASDSAGDYAALLRKIINSSSPLRMKAALGTNAVCTNCATALTYTFGQPQSDEQWHYSLGHWVEDDPSVGDGAFSSPGAEGFYPWIDSTKTWYGVLAREVSGGATGSILCGRQIRKAWLTGVAQ